MPPALRRWLACGLVGLLLAGLAAGLLWQQRTLQADLHRLRPGAVEIGFAQFMSLHHQQAIAMAQLLQDGRPTRLALLARDIEGTQQLELGEMRGWLALWDQPLLPAGRSMDWMLLGDRPPDAELRRYLLDCQRTPTGMPGLAADDELESLRRLDGLERDRLFLRLMRAHHDGALPMARHAAEQARLPAVRALAQRIALDQARERDLIERMLQALPATAD